MRNAGCIFPLIVVCWATAIGQQHNGPNKSLVINGHTGDVSAVVIGGKTYVDLESLVRIANGSLSFQGDQLVLTLPGPGETAAGAPEQPANANALSRDFMKAGIEEINLLREWASPLANAIQNGYPVAENWVARYRGKATNGLHLASTALSTGPDRDAFQLLSKEYNAVSEWSDHLVEAWKSMNAAKYSTSDNALRDDPLSQKIVTCGHFLASMLASGTFQDDGSCQ
jgi:hypothetical protein